jgi:polyphosphate kinase
VVARGFRSLQHNRHHPFTHREHSPGDDDDWMPKSQTVDVQPRFLNRELSWLDFSARLLDLADDETVPLLERVKFNALFSNALDEFFMVRVAGLLDQAASGLGVRSVDGLTARETLAAIRTKVEEQTDRQSRLWRKRLCPALANERIAIARVDECDERELRELERKFEREIFPVLTPLGVGPRQPFPYISGLSLSLGVLARDPDSGEERFARVKVPEGMPRFVRVDSARTVFIPLEDVLAHFLDRLFPGMEILERAGFRVTRDADFELSDDADDLLEAVRAEIHKRRFGDVVRLEVAESMSSTMLDRLRAGLRVEEEEIYHVHGLLGLGDTAEIAELDRPELKDEPWRPTSQTRVLRADDEGDIFAEIRRGDIFVHHPYESFATSFEQFIAAAARDPDVQALKTTVYRTGDESPVVPSLIAASEAGKQSVCLVELKARGDERRNVEWADALEQAGVHVVYGFTDLKIHAKTTLVVRREGNRLRRYVHIGTGNYHALTARVYEDFGLFTADEEIAADVADLFNFLTGFGQPQKFRKLLVAPLTLRPRLVELIRAVADAAAAGERAEIRLKVNQLTDPAIIEELYRASNAGAKIDVFARSISMLRPGVPGLSENIRVRSIVGRFLEHSRVFIFHAGEESHYLMGSADLMPRNLDHRIEIVTPIEQPRAQAELNTVFDALLADNVHAWELEPDDTWRRLRPEKGERKVVAQTTLMRRANARERRQAEYRSRES